MNSRAGACKDNENENAAPFRARLLAWYDSHARDLPWRKSRDPYRIWLSEIMLQQTRVAAVLGHYHEFLRRFPTVEKLAAAREPSVLAAWSGLGYYRRARMLQAAAKCIAGDLRGEFPRTADGLKQLPGIGRYTAAAVASIAFGEPVAVVDGNVERVLSRFFASDLSQEKIWQAAETLLDGSRPGDFNQAMMELGATVCTPRAPACLTCPVMELCATRGERPPAPKAPRQKKREIHFALARRNGSVFLTRRPRDARLMASMWELPEVSASRVRAPKPRSARNHLAKAESLAPLFTLRHSITVTDYTVQVWHSASSDAPGEWIPLRRLPKLALTGLARKILRRAEILS
ncbi:MAG: A/G-specific adenine glycosylase [Candidatus Sulfotelmatobacter sp.]